MITYILMAIGMADGVLVKELLPSGAAVGTACKGGCDGKPDNVKEWLKNKLKALARLPGRLGAKVAEALSGIIGTIISWILNRVKEVVGWVSQNLWALIVGAGGLLYTYIVTRQD